MKKPKSVALLGSGPAALMAAEVVSEAGHLVTLFEKRKGPGRKLLIAGSSGLNITNSLPFEEFIKVYTCPQSLPQDFWRKTLSFFSPQNWIQFIESLGLQTFEGTSGRFFVRDMKASKLLRSWLDRLSQRGVITHYEHECTDFFKDTSSKTIRLNFLEKSAHQFDAVCFALGGGSYETQEQPLRWPSFFKRQGIEFDGFQPSNVGFRVHWSEELLKEAEGLPLKNSSLTSSKGTRRGDIIITQYGLEGTPVYFTGETGKLFIDLKPDLTVDQIIAKCKSVKENLSPIRRIKKQLKLCRGSFALLYHMAPKSHLQDLNLLAPLIKSFPITLEGPQPLSESISSQGGIHLSEVNEDFMFHKFPGVFAAGEMLNWDAPTGGFLIQACVSQGYCAGKGILRYLEHL